VASERVSVNTSILDTGNLPLKHSHVDCREVGRRKIGKYLIKK
jgi:hypothetical protein